MVDLSTDYMGISLKHPVMPGAGPMVDDIDSARAYEDAGAAALCMRSLFEEQIVTEELSMVHAFDLHAESFAEATSYFAQPEGLTVGPYEYLEKLRRLREAVDLPVFASLNGSTPGRWLDYAQRLEEAGATGLELNLYTIAADVDVDAQTLEKRWLETVETVCDTVDIPVAVKLSPFYSAMANFAHRLQEAGARGLVLFNRFYQPDIDIDLLEVQRALQLSDPSELRLRLRWLAILSGRLRVSLAASGGIHAAPDVLKAIMAGADAVQMVSALLRGGPPVLQGVVRRLESWLDQHEYDSLEQARGSLNLMRCPDPEAYERANYISILQTWKTPVGR